MRNNLVSAVIFLFVFSLTTLSYSDKLSTLSCSDKKREYSAYIVESKIEVEEHYGCHHIVMVLRASLPDKLMKLSKVHLSITSDKGIHIGSFAIDTDSPVSNYRVASMCLKSEYLKNSTISIFSVADNGFIRLTKKLYQYQTAGPFACGEEEVIRINSLSSENGKIKLEEYIGGA